MSESLLSEDAHVVVESTLSIDSDHRLVWEALPMAVPLPERRAAVLKYNISALLGPEMEERFQMQLRGRFADVQFASEPNAAWKQLTEVVFAVADATIGKKKVGRRSHSWWCAELTEAVQERRELTARALQSQKAEDWTAVRLKRKAIKALVNAKKAAAFKSHCEEIVAGKLNTDAWQGIRRLAGFKRGGAPTAILNRAGVTVTTPAGIAAVFKDHLEALGKKNKPGSKWYEARRSPHGARRTWPTRSPRRSAGPTPSPLSSSTTPSTRSSPDGFHT